MVSNLTPEQREALEHLYKRWHHSIEETTFILQKHNYLIGTPPKTRRIETYDEYVDYLSWADRNVSWVGIPSLKTVDAVVKKMIEEGELQPRGNKPPYTPMTQAEYDLRVKSREYEGKMLAEKLWQGIKEIMGPTYDPEKDPKNLYFNVEGIQQFVTPQDQQWTIDWITGGKYPEEAQTLWEVLHQMPYLDPKIIVEIFKRHEKTIPNTLLNPPPNINYYIDQKQIGKVSFHLTDPAQAVIEHLILEEDAGKVPYSRIYSTQTKMYVMGFPYDFKDRILQALTKRGFTVKQVKEMPI